jgi:Domain of unknown function (DUF4185)
MNKKYNWIFFVLLSVLYSCGSTKQSAVANTDINNLKFTVEEASEWTKLLNRQHGWFGADGIFVLPANGVDKADSTVENTILFSDTMLGDIVNDRPASGFIMIHNSVALLKGYEPKEENIEFKWKATKPRKEGSFFIPQTPNAKPDDYYWLGDGFVNHELGDKSYIFCYRIRDTADNAFLFQQVANAMIILPKGSKPPYTDQRQVDAPIYAVDNTAKYPNNYISFGSAVFPNTKSAGAPNPDGYVYVYGVGGDVKKVMVARVKSAEFEDFSKWRYYDGSTWQTDILKSATIADRASNELSVTPLPDGRYAMVFQTDGIGNSVGLRLSTTPYGPFGPIIKIWDCTEQKEGKNFIVYNAKVHPSLSKPGEMLISYNVGSFDFWNDVKDHSNFYRPRFIRVKLQ